MARTAKLDCAAIVASSLCLVHCLALPLMVTALPFVAIVAEAKWLHWLLAAFAGFCASLQIAGLQVNSAGGSDIADDKPCAIQGFYILGGVFPWPPLPVSRRVFS